MEKTSTATPSNVLRVPPQNTDAERALLGAIMVRPTSLIDISSFVTGDTFYVDRHRIIYNTMLELHAKHEAIDLVTLSTRLRELNLLDQIGGTSYLTDLTNTVPSSTNINHYAEIVSRKNILRNLIDTGDFISELGFNEQEDIEEIIDQAEKKVFEVTAKSGRQTQYTDIKDVLPESWSTIERLHESSGELRGVATGFRDLDKKLSGLMNSDLIILAARPSMGKTSLALDIARQAALKGETAVGIFSLEMSSQQLVDRMLSAEAHVDSWKMRTGQSLTEKDFLRIRDAMGTLSKAPVFIDDQAGNSILKMRSVARRLKTEHNLGLIIVDYLQLMTTSKAHDSMVNQVTEISRSLKALARELDVPVLALSQLSRAVEARGGKPRLSDLRDSGSIEQDADVVMFIHREDKYNPDSDRPGIAEILIEKHRNGPTGMAELFFDDARTSFTNIERTEFEDYGLREDNFTGQQDLGGTDHDESGFEEF